MLDKSTANGANTMRTDEERPDTRVGTRFLYVISDPVARAVKVGYAGDIRDRLMDIQVGNPTPLTLSFLFYAPSLETARRVEGAVHAALKSRRTSGEWFRVSPDEAWERISAISSRLKARLEEYHPQTIAALIAHKKRGRRADPVYSHRFGTLSMCGEG